MIVEMTLNGSGVRDIARVLQISPTTVIGELKKRAHPSSGQPSCGEGCCPEAITVEVRRVEAAR